MTSRSAVPTGDPIADQADRLAARNGGPDALRPPAVAPQSPVHELLIRDIATSLPPELAAFLEATPAVADVQRWLAAGEIYHWVSEDQFLARTFLREVGSDPRRAGLALARAFAARMEPPPRDAQWHRCDRLGLALQLALAVVLLVARSLLFDALARGMTFPDLWEFGLAEFLWGIVGLGLLSGEAPAGLLGAVSLSGAVAWLALEGSLAPRAMEKLRRLPAQLKGLPPPLAWRADALYALWVAVSAVLLLGLCTRYWLDVVGAASSTGELAIEVVAGLLLVGVSAKAITGTRVW